MLTENLSRSQTHAVLQFVLARMGMDTRCALMAEMPVAYARLFPSVTPSVLLEKVQQAISVERTSEG